MAPDDEARQLRAAQNQSLFREINERIESLNESFAFVEQVGEWICECADKSCAQTMKLTIAEYEAIRRHGNRFPILPGHEYLDVEHVVERHDRYLVVEKIGKAADFARRHDPRASA